MNDARPVLLLTFCALLLTMLASTAPPTLARTLQTNRWKKRILLVVAPSAADPDYKRQHALLAAAPQALSERDFLVLDVLFDQLDPTDRQFLLQRTQLNENRFAVVLIGKDGGVKRTETQPISMPALFSTVDKMPMRQQEMRR
jgi:hypothetical protein